MSRSRAQLFLALVLALVACSRQQTAVTPDGSAPRRSDAKAAVRASAPGLEVNYLANEGFLVHRGDQGVLVDALFSDGVVGYQTMIPRVREGIERGTYWSSELALPRAVVRVALASHFHPDHFDPESVGRFLAASPQAVFISTPQAAESFRHANPERSALFPRFHAVLPQPGTVETLEFDGIRVDVLNLHHGLRSPPVENLGFVVTLGQERFIHFGDTEAKMEDLEPYLGILSEPDWALLPFWFLASEWRADMVRRLVRPKHIAVGHLPTPDAPPSHFARWRSYGELRATIEDAFPDAWIPTQPGETGPSSLHAPTPSFVN